ncbi:MAG: hypothetical protein VKJ86_06490 [Synechococcus sp.]|nr:hypothetical protein [Synechococcus sp.]
MAIAVDELQLLSAPCHSHGYLPQHPSTYSFFNAESHFPFQSSIRNSQSPESIHRSAAKASGFIRHGKALVAPGTSPQRCPQSILQGIRPPVEPSIEELTMISSAGNPPVYC